MPKDQRQAPKGDSARVRIIRAGWVAPMDVPPIGDGAVAFSQGVIVDVGPARDVQARHPTAELVDRSDNTLLPGLVNAHTHLELSALATGPRPASFVEWVVRLVPRGAGPGDLDAIHQFVARSVPIGVQECLRFGVTCVGDISRHCNVSRPILRDGPLRVVSYGEVQAMAQRRGMLDARLAVAADPQFDSPWLSTALSPHAPYSVEIEGFRRCLAVACEHTMPISTHLSETPDEAAFLADHSGPFRALWDALRGWDADVPRFAGGPIRFAGAIGLLDYERTLLAHVNYCEDAELDLLARGRASVVYCPRTHAFFGHPPHRWREMLSRGINVAIGTDSCASSPDLNLVDDLRLLRRIAPEVPAESLWQMATVHAARALDMSGRVGVLRPGAAADFALFPSAPPRPLDAILEDATITQEVWIAGGIVHSRR